MKKYLQQVSFITALASIVFFGTSVSHTYAAVSCTTLSYDLSSGSTDSRTKGEVTKLQTFLKAAGYLAASPTGNFGPATLESVKSFQVSTGINTTGTVGPLTRVAIQFKSCGAGNTSDQATTTSSTSTSDTSSTITSTSGGITAPVAGEHLVIGKDFSITWKRTGDNQTITLEDQTGLAQGFIASNRLGLNNFVWNVGSVFSGRTNLDSIVDPGSYRIRISGSGVDQVSAFFNIDAAPVAVQTMVPTNIAANGSSALVIYGNGFSDRTTVFIDTLFRTAANKLFISSDGKVIVVSIPSSVSVGTHTLILYSDYGTSLTAGKINVTSSKSGN